MVPGYRVPIFYPLIGWQSHSEQAAPKRKGLPKEPSLIHLLAATGIRTNYRLGRQRGGLVGDLRDIKLDPLRNAPVDVSFCAVEADAVLASKGKILFLEPKFLTAEFMPRSKIRQLPPAVVINSLDGHSKKFY